MELGGEDGEEYISEYGHAAKAGGIHNISKSMIYDTFTCGSFDNDRSRQCISHL